MAVGELKGRPWREEGEAREAVQEGCPFSAGRVAAQTWVAGRWEVGAGLALGAELVEWRPVEEGQGVDREGLDGSRKKLLA